MSSRILRSPRFNLSKKSDGCSEFVTIFKLLHNCYYSSSDSDNAKSNRCSEFATIFKVLLYYSEEFCDFDTMKIIFSVTIILLIGALVEVDAKDVSKELAELFHQSEADEKVLAKGYENVDDEKVLAEVESDNGDEGDDEVFAEEDDGNDENEDADALAETDLASLMADDGNDEDEDADALAETDLASLMADDSNEKIVANQHLLRCHGRHARRRFGHRHGFSCHGSRRGGRHGSRCVSRRGGRRGSRRVSFRGGCRRYLRRRYGRRRFSRRRFDRSISQ